MRFRFTIVELMYEHAAKHAQGKVAVTVTPAMKGLATAIETELQRFADDMDRRYARRATEEEA